MLSLLDWKTNTTRISKWTSIFSFDAFTWFDRARRALQNCIHQNLFESVFWDWKINKLFKKYLKNWKKLIFLFLGKKTRFFNKNGSSSLFLPTMMFRNITVRYSVKNCINWLCFETFLLVKTIKKSHFCWNIKSFFWN